MNHQGQEYLLALGKLRETQASLHSKWITETVKHLALINIAGLAGSSALLQAPTLGLAQVKVSLVLFFLGLVLSVIDFYLNALAFLDKIHETDRAMAAVSKADTPGEVLRYGQPNPTAGDSRFVIAGIVGWISAVCALAGGILIGYTMLVG